jgi:hypothetical protein
LLSARLDLRVCREFKEIWLRYMLMFTRSADVAEHQPAGAVSGSAKGAMALSS